jgi:hypothetical protein
LQHVALAEEQLAAAATQTQPLATSPSGFEQVLGYAHYIHIV